MRIKKGDQVVVIAGKNISKRGKVLEVFPRSHRAVVEKVNFVHKHRRPDRTNRQGGILQIEAPIDVSNLAVVCPHCDHVGRKRKIQLAEGRKVRVCPKCGEVLERD